MKKVKRKYIHTAHSILKDFGFLFEGNIWGNQGFNVYYPDNHKVLYGLYSFAHTLDYDIKSTIHVNMRFATMDSRLYTFSPQDEKQISVLNELFRFVKKDSEKDAIRLFHNQMIDKGYTYRLTVDLFDSDDYNPGICIRYDSAVYEPRAIIRANTTSKTSAIGIWLTDLGKQSEYIQSQSNVFKDSCTRLFDDCSNITCKYKKNHDKCKGKLLYTLDTVAHRKCTYKTAWGHIGNNTLFQLDKDEIDAYLYLIDNYNS